MNVEKEKIILENLISSRDIFSRCVSIIKPEYFEPEHRLVVSFLKDYYEKYKAIPAPELIKAEAKVSLKTKEITKDTFNYTCDSIEQFCQNSAMQHAILDSSSELMKENTNMGKIFEAVKAALSVSLPKDLGMEFFHNPEDRLKSFIDITAPYPTTINNIDKHLDLGPRRSTLTLFSANSGVGKSIMLANIGANYARQGLNVLYLSLELPESMIYLRLAAMTTEMPAKSWKENIPEISYKIEQIKEQGAGSYIVKRLPVGSSANDIRAYLKLYELEYDQVPDVLIVDYLDIMKPNEGTKGLSISEQDKAKAEQLNEILVELDAIGLSASQQNRDAINNNTPDQGVIAGGLTKVNAVDNYISIYMNAEMRLMGQMKIFFLKTRSSDGVGKIEDLYFDSVTLKIKDSENSITTIIPPKNNGKTKGKISKADEIIKNIKNDIPSEIKNEIDILNEKPIIPIIEKEDVEEDEDDLMNFMESIK